MKGIGSSGVERQPSFRRTLIVSCLLTTLRISVMTPNEYTFGFEDLGTTPLHGQSL